MWDEFLFNDSTTLQAKLAFPATRTDPGGAKLLVRSRNAVFEDVLERWLDGPPTLAALAQVQPPAPPAPRLPRLPQRSDRVRPRRRLG